MKVARIVDIFAVEESLIRKRKRSFWGEDKEEIDFDATRKNHIAELNLAKKLIEKNYCKEGQVANFWEDNIIIWEYVDIEEKKNE